MLNRLTVGVLFLNSWISWACETLDLEHGAHVDSFRCHRPKSKNRVFCQNTGAVAPWCSGTASADSSWRMLGLPHKSAACQFGAEDHCVGCQLVGCGFYDCPFAAQRVPRDGSVTTLFSSFEWSSKPFMLFSKFLTFPAMLSVTDHWCHLIVVAVSI